MENEITEKIIAIMRNVSTTIPTEILGTMKFRDLGIDSIQLVKIIVEIETELGCEFEDDKLSCQAYPNVGGFFEEVSRKLIGIPLNQ